MGYSQWDRQYEVHLGPNPMLLRCLSTSDEALGGKNGMCSVCLRIAQNRYPL